MCKFSFGDPPCPPTGSTGDYWVARTWYQQPSTRTATRKCDVLDSLPLLARLDMTESSTWIGGTSSPLDPTSNGRVVLPCFLWTRRSPRSVRQTPIRLILVVWGEVLCFGFQELVECKKAASVIFTPSFVQVTNKQEERVRADVDSVLDSKRYVSVVVQIFICNARTALNPEPTYQYLHDPASQNHRTRGNNVSARASFLEPFVGCRNDHRPPRDG
ncbi:hypothetical protein BDP81DRAFT_160204 [Colletotrichum phormii]|uniref:Uncharacterized protein n=1 Tax=Colletotrichum phormii TaxID=359342 RepID=A0AAJ0A0E3_9PEZI|nr:uncharacterized protein BDP81DRAFT_160204 [Colletotrichum phormii]KAK1640248.1 hypothetical protein BDP81DRAFT_160204 [Colletotrichum phormii]